MKYRKKPVIIEATQWFKNGDHPEDACDILITSDGRLIKGEGRVVRYYRRPNDSGERSCEHCGIRMHDHGWIDKPGAIVDYVVCPGDFIITNVTGERYPYPLKPAVFAATYEAVSPEQEV